MSDSEAPQEVAAETMETATEETPAEETAAEPQAEVTMEETPEEPEQETSVVVTDDTVPPGTEAAVPAMESEAAPEQPVAGPEKPEETPKEEAPTPAAEPVPEVDPETRAMIEDLDSELPDEIDSPKVLVQSLAESTSEDTLKEYFSKFGEVRIAKLKKDGEGKSKGFAFIIFSDTANIAKALEQSDHEIDGGCGQAFQSNALVREDENKQTVCRRITSCTIRGTAPCLLREIREDPELPVHCEQDDKHQESLLFHPV